ncbi:MAG: hypothetical protein HC769_17765 [Cyanobacteria bacterium CRU_2_1]|nr:hypothetical protein [Cyanobacteria bacterium CRU_2_1]
MLNKLIRNAMIASTLTLPAVAFTSEAALADKSNFHVYNNSSVSLVQLYISESELSTWGNDVLGQDVLPSGYSTQILFNDPSPYQCLYDIRAVFEDGQVLEDYQINVCSNDQYTFSDN